jgi:predicted MPP superfamily phosphohydrolase
MRAVKYALAALGALAALLLAWGLVEPYFIVTEEEEAEIPGLPAAWEGERIGLISDWQIGMWLDNTYTVRRSVELMVEERPAAVLIAGDFVYGASDEPDEDLAKVEEFVRPLSEAGIPTYAVLGNHDYRMAWSDSPPNPGAAETMRATLEEAGVRVLKNESVELPSPRGGSGVEPLNLVGVGARWPDEDRPHRAFSGFSDDAPRLAMMHNPYSFSQFPAYSAPLAVAGHTHGGQVGIPFTPEWSYLASLKEGEAAVAGWIDDLGEQGNRLYVSRGIGFGLVPIRINRPPEATLFTLRSSGTTSSHRAGSH